MSDDVAATRAELIKVKARIKLAQNGHKLLKKKRDGLIMEFFALLKRARHVRDELDAFYRGSIEKMNMARVLEGDMRVQSLAFAVREQPEVRLAVKNIIGVAVPKLEGSAVRTQRSFFDSIAITEAAERYETLIEKVVEAAELETAIRKLLQEIEKTKRRVNALEFEVIPRLLATKAHIQLRLDEIERENFYRLKISKKKLAAEAA